jgi:dTDP-4-amino-4,6-dideoxy-D-galactose acyltransferase
MTGLGVNFEFLPWDSEFFGVPIGRARVKTLARRDVHAVDRWAAEEGIRCVYVMCDCADEDISRDPGSAGLLLTDVRITYERPVALRRSRRTRPARPEDSAALEEIARTSHRNTRFYRDARFPRERSDALYVEWIRKSLSGERARAVFVADEGAGPIGYVTCETRDRSPLGTIGLIAVAPEARGRGLGADLLEAGNNFFHHVHKTSLRALTQQDNAAAVRMYEAAGFIPLFSERCYHKWYGGAS